MKKKNEEFRLLFLIGNTEIVNEQRQELRLRAEEMGCEISIQRNYSNVRESVDPSRVVLVITINHDPKSVPEAYLQKPVLKVLIRKNSTPEIKKDSSNNLTLIAQKVFPGLIFKLILEIRDSALEIESRF